MRNVYYMIKWPYHGEWLGPYLYTMIAAKLVLLMDQHRSSSDRGQHTHFLRTVGKDFDQHGSSSNDSWIQNRNDRSGLCREQPFALVNRCTWGVGTSLIVMCSLLVPFHRSPLAPSKHYLGYWIEQNVSVGRTDPPDAIHAAFLYSLAFFSRESGTWKAW